MNELQSHVDIVDDLAEEFIASYRRGERPPVSQFAARCPDRADEIRELFPTLVIMEQAVRDDTDERWAAGRRQRLTPRQLGDFRIIREVGRGGMGIVYEAEQISLGRRVALKLLPKQTFLDSKHQKRFLREAKSAARLHHTNIVPVFGVGQQDGLHYYVMQFIHGLGLDEVLVELQRLSDQPSAITDQRTTTDPPSYSTLNTQHSTTQHADTVVGQLSDTLPGHSEHTTRAHYWHSVARIGLQAAQALQYAHDQGIIHRDVKPGNLLLDTSGSVWITDFGLAKAADQQDLTHTGDVLGTLRYMAPEQFDGHADARSDVYSLGLTLYEMLSLKPAFDEADRRSLVRQVTTGTPPRLRSLDRTIPRDLETIVHKAIDREPAQRYRTAGELAADLGRFLGDEPIRARRPPILQRLGKWTRRHRAVVVTAGLCLLVGTVLLAGTIGWAVRDRTAAHAARQARLATEVELILDDVDRLEEDERWDEALAAAWRADAALASGEGAPTVQERVGQALDELKMVHRLEQIRLERAVWREGGFDNTGAAASYARAFREFGIDLEVLTSDEAVSRLNEHPNIRLALAAALDDYSVARAAVNGYSDDVGLHLVDVARRIDPDPQRDRFRAVLGRPATAEDRSELQALAERINVGSQAPATLVMLARLLHRIGLQQAEQSLLERAQLHHPDDFWINFDLARCAAERNDNEGAIRYYSMALAARPSANAARNNLGARLLGQTRLDEAEATFRRAIELEPGFAFAHANLGDALREQGELKEAIACYRTAIELDPGYSAPHTGLGIVFDEQNRFGEAEAAYRRAIELDPEFAPAHFNLGSLLRQQKRFSEAEAPYRQGIHLDPRDARAHNHLGIVLFEQNRHHEAGTCFRRAIELVSDHVYAHTNLGNALLEQTRFDEAEASYRRAIELDPAFANAHFNLGRLLIRQNRFEEAEASYRRAIELDPDYAHAHYNLGRLLMQQNRFDEAEALFLRAIELDADDPRAHIDLGQLYADQNRLDEAEASFRRAMDRDAAYAPAHANLRDLMWKTGRFAEALAAGGRAVELCPDDASSQHMLAWHLVTCPDGRLRDAARGIELATRAIEIEPDGSGFHGTLGVAHYRAGHWRAAIDALTRAIEQPGKNAAAFFFLAMAHWQMGEREGAGEWFQKAANRMEDNDPDDEELLRFRTEAEELIKSQRTRPINSHVFSPK